MIALIAAYALLQGPDIHRDDYGVPHVKAATLEEAFFHAGYAVAQDRMWQMENSRRVARGRMAEAFGSAFSASDREVLSFAYTDDELRTQIANLSPKTRTMIKGYVGGINAWIAEASQSKKLPTGYETNGFQPEPWSDLDTAAITIRLFQQFGKGGAGEIRNMALLGYVQGRKETKDRVLDVLEDFAWFNDKSAKTTVLDADDPLKSTHNSFPIPTRAISEKHLASLPKVNLLELLPGVRLAEMQESSAVAESVSAPCKWGSYAIVVGPERSATGYPILLSAPQLGFRSPSIVHEMSISAPDYRAVGMDIPGVPGIAIGHNEYMAWGLTSGVADTDDIYFNSTTANGYLSDGVTKPFQVVQFAHPIKGEENKRTFIQKRSEFGPVVVESASAKVAFSRCSASRGRELESLESVADIGSVQDQTQIEGAMRHATVNFNFFYATRDGQIGYRYSGLVPQRSSQFDPRFPLPGAKENRWAGMIPFEQMPHVNNPKGGLLANWNNKPVAWWPNSDTPVWGQIFRNSELLNCLMNPKLGTPDLERAAWTIARKDETWPYFRSIVEKVWQGSNLAGFDGWMLDGSPQAQAYRFFLDDLREILFLGVTGNFVSPDNFKLVAQPSVMLRALQGKTKVNYLQGRSAEAIIKEALVKSTERMAKSGAGVRFVAPPIQANGQPPIPYSNRGTYIQIVELMKSGIQGRNVVTPGVAESGPHSQDQVHHARAWTYKPMRIGN